MNKIYNLFDTEAIIAFFFIAFIFFQLSGNKFDDRDKIDIKLLAK
jgi:hypothetical protein